MKKTILVAILLAGTAFVNPASAASFTLSNLNLPADGSFGSITAAFISATTVHVAIDMTPNFILDNGNGHIALGLTLLGTGRIDATSLSDPLFTSVLAHGGDYKNSPYMGFTDGITGNCNDADHPCPATLSFNILDFQGFGTSTSSPHVYAAVDIFQKENCMGSCTGAVAVGVEPTPTPFSPVPGPVVGAGIPGLLTACFGMFGLNRWRRRRQTGLISF